MKTKEITELLNVTPQSISHWNRTGWPITRAMQLEILSKGEVKASDKLTGEPLDLLTEYVHRRESIDNESRNSDPLHLIKQFIKQSEK